MEGVGRGGWLLRWIVWRGWRSRADGEGGIREIARVIPLGWGLGLGAAGYTFFCWIGWLGVGLVTATWLLGQALFDC